MNRRPTKPVRWLSDAELDELARITPEDIARAKASARQYGSALFNALLDATPLDEPSAGEPRPLDGLLLPGTAG